MEFHGGVLYGRLVSSKLNSRAQGKTVEGPSMVNFFLSCHV
jgi:hypothetical protein